MVAAGVTFVDWKDGEECRGVRIENKNCVSIYKLYGALTTIDNSQMLVDIFRNHDTHAFVERVEGIRCIINSCMQDRFILDEQMFHELDVNPVTGTIAVREESRRFIVRESINYITFFHIAVDHQVGIAREVFGDLRLCKPVVPAIQRNGYVSKH